MIAADRFVRIDGLRNLQLWRFSALDQIENERRGPDLHGRGPLAHVRIAQDYVKPAIAAGVNMRFVPRVDQGPAVHCVNAHQHAEKIRALRNLKYPRLSRRALRFDTHLAGASEDLARDEKRQNARDDPVPCDLATYQVIVVTAVTVADKIGVVLVKTDFVGRW